MYYSVDTSPQNFTLGQLVSSGVSVFNEWWETYIPDHKETLEKKIIRAYYFHVIGAETPDKFIYELNATLEQIMPYYNQLYKSELIKFNPLLNYAVTENGRSVENLSKATNKSKDAVAKAVRDFVTKSNASDTKSGNNRLLENITVDTKNADRYSKAGDETTTETRGTDFDETEKTVSETERTKTAGTTENEDTHQTTDKITDSITKETPGETTLKTTNWGQTVTDTGKSDVNDVKDIHEDDKWTETKDDDSTTEIVTDGNTKTTSSSQTDYADTPQLRLSTGGVGDSSIRKDYLTNVTWKDDSVSSTEHSDQNTTFKDDQTITHDGAKNTKNLNTKVQNTSNSSQKGGTDQETISKTGTNTTEVNGSETTESSGARNLGRKETENENSLTKTDRSLHSTESMQDKTEKEWKESGDKSGTSSKKTDGTTTNVLNENTISENSGRELSDLSKSETEVEKTGSEETTDKGSSYVAEGFKNVSPAELLEAFRRTFINVDELIINALRDNFMLIY